MNFEFTVATRVLFGPGTIRQAGPLARDLGTRALVVTGATVERAGPLLALLNSNGVSPVTFSLTGEPTVAIVVHGAQTARAEGCDLVVSFGGGSATDAGKAIAALMTNPGDVLDYLEIIGSARPLDRPPAPFMAIPTTAGAGAEVTRNAVLASPEHKVKVSLRSARMAPKIALVDPELTYGLPPAITATTGVDALTQVIEPYLSCKANPLTDAICSEGIRRAARSLRRAFDNGADKAAREDMALAGLLGGLALSNAGLGAVHGLAAPIGGMFSAPHGAVCAALLPHVMEANLIALHERAPRSEGLQRFDEVARLLMGTQHAGAAEGIAWVKHLCGHLQVQPLRRYGIRPNDYPKLIAKAGQASSMKANPIPLTDRELQDILGRAW